MTKQTRRQREQQRRQVLMDAKASYAMMAIGRADLAQAYREMAISRNAEILALYRKPKKEKAPTKWEQRVARYWDRKYADCM